MESKSDYLTKISMLPVVPRAEPIKTQVTGMERLGEKLVKRLKEEKV